MKFYKLLLILCILSIFNISSTKAQRKQTNGPTYVEIISALAVLASNSGDTNLYAGTYRGGVFLSTNNGDSWESIVGKNWDSNTGSFTKKNITALLPIKDDEGNINLFA